MTVYILMGDYGFEGVDVVDLYASETAAMEEAARMNAEAEEEEHNYFKYYVYSKYVIPVNEESP